MEILQIIEIEDSRENLECEICTAGGAGRHIRSAILNEFIFVSYLNPKFYAAMLAGYGYSEVKSAEKVEIAYKRKFEYDKDYERIDCIQLILLKMQKRKDKEN